MDFGKNVIVHRQFWQRTPLRVTIQRMEKTTQTQQKKWQIAPEVPQSVLADLANYNPIVAQLLYNRGIHTKADADAFTKGIYVPSANPFLLKDMDVAVARITQAIQNEERIVVYGDFDADGVTSTVLLVQALRKLGVSPQNAQPYIPDRVDEGYGLNMEAIEKLKAEKEAHLVITVDCGIRSVAEVAYANTLGLDMIITDHHSLGSELPPATAVINPKRPDSDYPETMLAGVGIAFKLVQALRQTLPDRATFTDNEFLDLVAIGTVADLAPLLGENRKLVIEGLTTLNNSIRPGIGALTEIARVKDKTITAETIGFSIGPRINAAGRLAHAYTAARALNSNNTLDAQRFAQELEGLNQQRQQITNELTTMAESLVEPNAPILIVADPSFVSGVVGLVASRLADKYYRPAIVMEMGETESRGSCRSITEFHITDALDEVADILVRHGGHAQAAGFTVCNENLPQFVERITAIARRQLDGLTLIPTITIDREVTLDEVDQALFAQLAALEPTGVGNPAPIFVSRNVEVIHHRTVGRDNAHLQMRLSPMETIGGTHKIFPAIAFRMGQMAQALPQYIDVVYTLSENHWNGRTEIQLIVQDIKPAQR